MSIQPISGDMSVWQTMKTDLQALSKALGAAQNARQSGSQDTVQISQEALQKAAAALQNDFAGLQGSTKDSGANTTTSATASSSPFQTLNQDLTALQKAIQSGDSSQI